MNIMQNYAGVFTSVRKSSKNTPSKNTVSVFRYLRHFMNDVNGDDMYADDMFCEISNLGGVTFLFSIDQDAGTLAYSYFICNKSDNFSKSIGRDRATDQFAKKNIVQCIHYDRDISLLDNVFVDLLIKSRLKDADYVQRKLFILKNIFKEIYSLEELDFLKNIFKEIYSLEELDYIEDKLSVIENKISTHAKAI